MWAIFAATILGDGLARFFGCWGIRVITDNHMATVARSLANYWWAGSAIWITPQLQRDPIVKWSGSTKRSMRHRIRSGGAGTGSPGASEAGKEVIPKTCASAGDAGVVTGPIRRRFTPARGEVDYSHGESFYNRSSLRLFRNCGKNASPRKARERSCVFSDDSLPPKQDPFLKQEDGQWKPNPAIDFRSATADSTIPRPISRPWLIASKCGGPTKSSTYGRSAATPFPAVVRDFPRGIRKRR